MTRTSRTAEFLERALAFSGLSQREVAARAGFDKPNMISMMKTGETRVPIERIPALARACGVDPVPFLRTALREYQPETWRVLVSYLGQPLTRDEEVLIDAYDEAREGRDLDLSPAMRDALVVLFRELFEMKETHAGFPRE
ncbi:helix-turn-helix transcriptional regulator [Halovulum dunhuangense]|uniref:Helix-turn-helix transcriptional regulator n=1 Tax=Halovulum dunhuangense TaxID=1505036 RepID=A0A849L6Y3_9RHOB|nr:helix-turn-helix transcriptional regulator [Halovulum dunhuangense]NNU82176.1 helix-turn-helix transcriptional regulator [Halovulum dunhuangense]